MKQNPRLVWISVLVLGWLLDFLFWKQAPGINFAIYAGLCLMGGVALLRLDGARMAPRTAWLVPFIAVLALTTFVRAEPLTLFLGVVLTLLLMAIVAISFRGGRWLDYSIGDYALGLVRLAWSIITRPIAFRAQAASKKAGDRPASSGAWPILRGILLALPILILFAALLGSADLVFRRQLDALMRLLSIERLPEYIFRLMYIVLAAFALLGVFLHAALDSGDERLLGRERPLPARFLGFTEASMVLGGVAILFMAFVIVQFRYFFGGQANISLEGFTYSEYARRGYGELLTVAFFSLLMILGLGAITRRDSPVQKSWFSTLSALIVLMVGVMLVSAFARLTLYEAAYGFSRLRTYVHVSLIWLGLLLAAVVVLEILRRERLFAAVALVGAIGFALTLSLLNVDALIVRHNVERALRGEELDVPHLTSLSTDSVPPLVELFASPSTPAGTREALGAALSCRLSSMPADVRTDWRSFTVSRWQADQSLATIAGQLSAYHLVEQDWPITITGPQGTSYDCYTYRD